MSISREQLSGDTLDLYDAIQDGDCARVSIILITKKSINLDVLIDGETFLDIALKTGKSLIIGDLLKAGVKVNQQCLNDSETPLHIFLRQSNQRWPHYLFTQNLLLDCINVAHAKTGETPLHIAVSTNNYSAVGQLLENGAHINARLHKAGHTPLHLAVAHGFHVIMERLLRDEDNRDVLDINATCSNELDGLTPLHLAAMSADMVAVNLLMSYGADASLTFKGETPAQIVMKEHYKNKSKIVEPIIQRLFNYSHKTAYDKKYFSKTSLPENANVEDMITHAAKDDNRSRKVCVDLGLMDAEGKLIHANRFTREAQCKAIFWKAYGEQYKSEWFKISNVNENMSMDEIIEHAKSADNRTSQVFKLLGWMNEERVVIKNPREEINEFTEVKKNSII